MRRIRVREDVCSGCLSCVAACSTMKMGYSSSSSACLHIDLNLLAKNRVRICRQCPDSPCAKACPEHAIIQLSKDSIWIIDYDKCNGCRKCIAVCPFDAIFWDSLQEKAIKCDLCGDTSPACVDACPTEALSIIDFLPRDGKKGRET